MSAAEKELTHYCTTIINLINNRDFDYEGPEAQRLRTQHISPSWQGRHPTCAWTTSFEEQTELWRQMTLDHPGLEFELAGVDCRVREKDRTADVVMRAAYTRGEVRLLTACEMKWKFSEGRWIWYYHCGMRGIC